MFATSYIRTACLVGLLLATPVAGFCADRRNQVNGLIAKLESADWRERSSAAFALGGLGGQARHALPALWKAKSDEQATVRKWAATSLDRIYRALDSDVSLEELVERVASEPPPPNWIRIAAKRQRGPARDVGLTIVPVATGDAEQDSANFGGRLVITLPPGPHDAFDNAGTVRLGPTSILEVRLKDHVPQCWEEREIISARQLQGEFGVCDLPELSDDCRWLVDYDDLASGKDRDCDGREDVTLLVVPNGVSSLRSAPR